MKTDIIFCMTMTPYEKKVTDHQSEPTRKDHFIVLSLMLDSGLFHFPGYFSNYDLALD